MTAPRSRLMATLTIVAMLAIGVFIGVALDRNLLPRRGDYRGRRDSGPFGMMSGPADTAIHNRMRARIMKRITEDLALTPSQAHSVDSIFSRRELQLDSLRARVGPQLDSLREQMRLSIDAILTPEQRIKFAEQRKKMDARRAERSDDGARERD